MTSRTFDVKCNACRQYQYSVLYPEKKDFDYVCNSCYDKAVKEANTNEKSDETKKC